MDFTTGKELLELCRAEGITIAEAMQRREESVFETNRREIRAQMEENLSVMEESIRLGMDTKRSQSGLSGGDAQRLLRYSREGSASGRGFCTAVAASMAVVEWNAAMGRIVAAPTAGASGILPGTLLTLGQERNLPREALVDALFTAGAVGMLIATHATVAGADGGCQAETGTAASMAAAALVEALGGTPRMALWREPWPSRTLWGWCAIQWGAWWNAPVSSETPWEPPMPFCAPTWALAGIQSVIPFDDAVSSMAAVGRALPSELRETARGGLAATPAAQACMACAGYKGS